MFLWFRKGINRRIKISEIRGEIPLYDAFALSTKKKNILRCHYGCQYPITFDGQLDVGRKNRMSSPFVGTWSFNAAFEEGGARDTKLVFNADGSGRIISGAEEVPMAWESPEDSRLAITVSGHRYGPFEISIGERDMPRGRFIVMESKSGILPFGLKLFSKVA